MGTSKFHITVDAWLYLFICHMKRFIRTFCIPYGTAKNENFVHKKILNPQVDNSLICYIEPSTLTYIKTYQGLGLYLYTSYK